ncbi:MAG: hypothetical protein EON60_09675 [Alphaproteobacteria bacterium]|nr:MAG: hypothetical protein EON60_09675 [Alphaproteobacteria bacterium]
MHASVNPAKWPTYLFVIAFLIICVVINFIVVQPAHYIFTAYTSGPKVGETFTVTSRTYSYHQLPCSLEEGGILTAKAPVLYASQRNLKARAYYHRILTATRYVYTKAGNKADALPYAGFCRNGQELEIFNEGYSHIASFLKKN